MGCTVKPRVALPVQIGFKTLLPRCWTTAVQRQGLTLDGMTSGGSLSTYTTASVTSNVLLALWKKAASGRRTSSLTPGRRRNQGAARRNIHTGHTTSPVSVRVLLVDFTLLEEITLCVLVLTLVCQLRNSQWTVHQLAPTARACWHCELNPQPAAVLAAAHRKAHCCPDNACTHRWVAAAAASAQSHPPRVYQCHH